MNTRLISGRQAVYDALDALPTPLFVALLMAMSGVNRVIAETLLDDPTPAQALDAAMAPFLREDQ